MMEETICYLLVYLFEALIAWLYFDYLFAQRRTSALIVLSLLFGYLLCFAVSRLEITAANTASFCLCNLLILLVDYQCSIKTALMHATFLSFIMTASEILIVLVFRVFGYDFAAYTQNSSIMVALAIASKLLYLIAALVSARLFSPHKRATEEPQMMVMFCGLPLFSMIISIVIAYLGLHEDLTKSAEVMIVITFMALLTVNLFFFILYNSLQKANEEYLTLQLSIQKEKADTEYYHALQKQSDSQQIMIHDIKNHLRAINSLANDGKNKEITAYIASLETNLSSSQQARLSMDAIVNMILLQISSVCREKGIEIHYDIRENGVTLMDAPSKTALYGNLLTNAIEAAEQSKEKLIEFSMIGNIEQENFIISVTNSCDTPPMPDSHGRYITHKRDAQFHGVGLRSVDRIVHKHEGLSAMHYDDAKKQFHHVIQFPISPHK